MWLVASYCISFFKKSKEKNLLLEKTKMQNASFLVLTILFWILYCMYMLYFFFQKRPTKCVIWMFVFLFICGLPKWRFEACCRYCHKITWRKCTSVTLRWGRFAHVAGLQPLNVLRAHSKSILCPLKARRPPWCHYCPFPVWDSPLDCGKCGQHIWTEVSLSHRF